jgi:hypothetical protein
MNQNIWGPHLWFSLHTISFTYPLNPTSLDKENYKNLFEDLKNVIPCIICKKNYIRHLNENPIDNHLKSRKELVYWVIDMHNMVNAETGKKILSYDIAIKKYESVYKTNINLEKEDEDKKEYFNNYNSENDILKINNDKYNYPNKYIKVINIIFIIFIILLVINLIYMLFYSSKSSNN